MKTLNQCSKRIGETVTLGEAYGGDLFSIGDTLMIKGFNINLFEQGANNYTIEGQPFFDAEFIKTVVYIVESFDGKRGMIFPDETVNGYIAPDMLNVSPQGRKGHLKLVMGSKK